MDYYPRIAGKRPWAPAAGETGLAATHSRSSGDSQMAIYTFYLCSGDGAAKSFEAYGGRVPGRGVARRSYWSSTKFSRVGLLTSSSTDDPI